MRPLYKPPYMGGLYGGFVIAGHIWNGKRAIGKHQAKSMREQNRLDAKLLCERGEQVG